MKRRFTFSSQRNGQVLIEALIATSVLTIGFLGVIALLNRSLGLNRVVADNYTATYLAAEGVEIAKNLLDANLNRSAVPWYGGLAGGDYELQYDTDWDTAGRQPALYLDRTLGFDPTTGLYSYDISPISTQFKRKVSIDIVSPVEVRVISQVSWVTRGNASFDVELEDHFYNWRY